MGKFRTNKNRNKDRERIILGRVRYFTIVNSANKRNLEFSIDLDNFIKLSKSNCYYCGSEPSNTTNYYEESLKYNGLDRKDNKLGYTLGNVVPCCYKCNRAKSDMGYEEFIEWIQKVNKHLNLS